MADQTYFYATGRRKTSVARVRLFPGGTGTIIIGGKPLNQVVPRPVHRAIINRPFEVTGSLGKYNVVAKVDGGGLTGWAGALSHGIARALVKADESLRPTLRQQGFLTRDSRMKERKKYGLKRARKAPQYTKR